jgi:MFS family permease
MSRYAAAELYPPATRGLALSVVVWAGTAGAVIGPGVIAPATDAARALHIVPLVGPFLAALAIMLGALVALWFIPRLRVDRSAAPTLRCPDTTGSIQQDGPVGFAVILRLPAVGVALSAMLCTQFGMAAVMTMAPVHIHHHGHGLAFTSWVLMAHSLGMFGLSPVSGRLSDRFGGRAVILIGLLTLAASGIVSLVAPSDSGPALVVALFLLGLAWNLTFIGGSALLGTELPASDSVRARGIVEVLRWSSSAAATLASGWIFAAGGYSFLVLVAGTLGLVPAVMMIRHSLDFKSTSSTSVVRQVEKETS